MTETSRPMPKGPGMTHGALTLALAVLIAAVALTARQQPPPSVAELAPQATQQIKEALAEQASRFGTGAGGEGAGEAATTTTTSTTAPPAASAPPTIDRARVRRCIGEPPRQIEDPQSPPCVPYWEGDNGGATWKGVTRDEIRVVVPTYDSNDDLLVRFFNARFEFYGRKIVPVNTRDEQSRTPEQQIATATRADLQHKAFASTHNDKGNDFSVTYYAELARRGLLSATNEASLSQDYMRAYDPHIWQYPMNADDEFAAMGAWACGRLVGKNANHAGDVLRGRPRVFGAIVQVGNVNFPLDESRLRTALAKCGGTLKVVVRGTDQMASQAANVMLQFSQGEVTSIFCLCHATVSKFLASAATSHAYFPEWLLSSYILQDDNYAVKTLGMPSEQRRHAFGLSFNPKQLVLSSTPAWQAMKESDPGYTDTYTIPGNLNGKYRYWLLLASGIQMAGPRLTPATFARGLRAATFPNPDSPLMAGKVGFPGRTNSMTRDAAEVYWSEDAVDPYPKGGAGALCYVDRGARRDAASMPSDGDPFFTGPCDSGATP